MGVDIKLIGSLEIIECRCSECGNVHEREHGEKFYDGYLTHNLAPMAKACGLYDIFWSEHKQTFAEEMLPQLKAGYLMLISNPVRFKKYNPENGFGSYDGFVEMLHGFIKICEENPKALFITYL